MLDRSSQSSTHIPTDALSEVLQDFRLSGVNYGRCELRDPWSIAFPQQQLLRFHFVSEGPCWIYTETHGWQELQAGDLVLLPQGVEHRLASRPDVVEDSLKSCQVIKLGERLRSGAGRNRRDKHPVLRFHGLGCECAQPVDRSDAADHQGL